MCRQAIGKKELKCNEEHVSPTPHLMFTGKWAQRVMVILNLTLGIPGLPPDLTEIALLSKWQAIRCIEKQYITKNSKQ
jgi:hypothetical protein